MKSFLPGAARAVCSAGLLLLALDAGAQEPVAERNYAGEPCVYFYRPVERGSDGQMRVNEYAEGTAVCHGSRMYRCEQRSWRLLGGCSAYDPGFVASTRSEVLEGYLNRGAQGAPSAASPPAAPAAPDVPPAPIAGAAPDPPTSAGAVLTPVAPDAPAAAAAPTVMAPPATQDAPSTAASPAPAGTTAAPAEQATATPALVLESQQPSGAEAPPAPPAPPAAVSATPAEPAPAPSAQVAAPTPAGDTSLAAPSAAPTAPENLPQAAAIAPPPAAGPGVEPPPRLASVSAVLAPSCLSSFVPGIDRLAQHDYRQFVVGASLRGQEPEVLSRMALRAAAQGEYFKALYLSRIALDYDQFSVDLWDNHASFAEQVQLTAEAQQARANARARRQSEMRALTPTLDYGMPLPAQPATLADWAALFSLLADDAAARADHGDILAVAQVIRLSPISLQDAWTQSVGMKHPQESQVAMTGLPIPVLWASGRSRAAFVTAQVRLPAGDTKLARRTTLGQQAAGQAPSQGSVALAGRDLAVPRLATICAADALTCTPALLPLEVMLSDDDFTDVGIASLPTFRTTLAQRLADLSARASAGEPLLLMPGNTGDTASPAGIAAVDAEGACISFEPGPDAWLSPAR